MWAGTGPGLHQTWAPRHASRTRAVNPCPPQLPLTRTLTSHSPLQTIQERAQTPGAVEQALLGLQESTAQAARAAALAAVDALLLTDAGLMFSPGQLALCAVRAGLSKVRLASGGYTLLLLLGLGGGM